MMVGAYKRFNNQDNKMQEQIEEQAYETYQKNMDYISKEHKEGAKLLSIFDKALNNG